MEIIELIWKRLSAFTDSFIDVVTIPIEIMRKIKIKL